MPLFFSILKMTVKDIYITRLVFGITLMFVLETAFVIPIALFWTKTSPELSSLYVLNFTLGVYQFN